MTLFDLRKSFKFDARALAAVTVFTSLPALTGCLVAGVSSNGGAFIWPGGFGLLLVILLIFFLMRRR